MVVGVVDGKHDERAVPEHVRNIRATPSPGGHLDEGLKFAGLSDDSRRRGHIRDDRLLQVNNDVGVGFDVVDPVTSTVSPGHPGNKQLAVVVVQEDLDACAGTALGPPVSGWDGSVERIALWPPESSLSEATRAALNNSPVIDLTTTIRRTGQLRRCRDN